MYEKDIHRKINLELLIEASYGVLKARLSWRCLRLRYAGDARPAIFGRSHPPKSSSTEGFLDLLGPNKCMGPPKLPHGTRTNHGCDHETQTGTTASCQVRWCQYGGAGGPPIVLARLKSFWQRWSTSKQSGLCCNIMMSLITAADELIRDRSPHRSC